MYEVHLSSYSTVLLVLAVFASAGLGARIAHFLGKRWATEWTTWMMWGSGLAAGFTAYNMSIGLALFGGPLYVGIGIIACPILVAFSWLFLLGGVRGAERILIGLEKKLTTT